MEEPRHICKRWDEHKMCVVCHKVIGVEYPRYKYAEPVYFHEVQLEVRVRRVIAEPVKYEIKRKTYCSICQEEIGKDETVAFYKDKEIHTECRPKLKSRRQWEFPVKRFANCVECGKELTAHKIMYCSSHCGWTHNSKKHGNHRPSTPN
jgi:hypothetical protein